MKDAFFLGAGFSKAVCQTMPTMMELFRDLRGWIGELDGFTREAYEYASGNVETLLSYYAIPSPSDDSIKVLRKQRVTQLLEDSIGRIIQDREERAASAGLNPNGEKLIAKWNQQQSHVLTTNYDTLVERISHYGASDTTATVLYPISVAPAIARRGHNPEGIVDADTFTLYKLHGSLSWFISSSEPNTGPIYALSGYRLANSDHRRLVGDKRRFIAPPVFDKSTLLSHESIRNLWWQAKNRALAHADRLYVIGYSRPDTDLAMRTLLWESRSALWGEPNRKIPLHVVDTSDKAASHYRRVLGDHYDVIDTYAGIDDAFDRFVEEYTQT